MNSGVEGGGGDISVYVGWRNADGGDGGGLFFVCWFPFLSFVLLDFWFRVNNGSNGMLLVDAHVQYDV